MSLYTIGLTILNIAVVSFGWYAVWNLRIKKIPFVIKFFELDANDTKLSTKLLSEQQLIVDQPTNVVGELKGESKGESNDENKK